MIRPLMGIIYRLSNSFVLEGFKPPVLVVDEQAWDQLLKEVKEMGIVVSTDELGPVMNIAGMVVSRVPEEEDV